MKKSTIAAFAIFVLAALTFAGAVYFDRLNKIPEKKMVQVGYTHNLVEIQGEVMVIEPQLENITIKTGTPAIFRSYTIKPSMLAGIKPGDTVKIKTEYRDINVKKIEIVTPPKQGKTQPSEKGAKKEPTKDTVKK